MPFHVFPLPMLANDTLTCAYMQALFAVASESLRRKLSGVFRRPCMEAVLFIEAKTICIGLHFDDAAFFRISVAQGARSFMVEGNPCVHKRNP